MIKLIHSFRELVLFDSLADFFIPMIYFISDSIFCFLSYILQCSIIHH